ncbi:unnamed protein product, partial [Aphanomyces euteiches]
RCGGSADQLMAPTRRRTFSVDLRRTQQPAAGQTTRPSATSASLLAARSKTGTTSSVPTNDQPGRLYEPASFASTSSAQCPSKRSTTRCVRRRTRPSASTSSASTRRPRRSASSMTLFGSTLSTIY